MIFLTKTAQRCVESEIGIVNAPVAIIPHGINNEFRRNPGQHEATEGFSPSNPFSWLYVSIVNLYKHQWNVVEAIANLREEGCHLALDLVGPANAQALQRLKETMKNRDPDGQFVRYLGRLPHQQLPDVFHNADGFIFASSCENMPIILLEAMTSGLPIACSDRGPMPEVLRDSGIYFDPEDVTSIMNAVRELYLNQTKRSEIAAKAFQYAECFTWTRCADETFSFLSAVAAKHVTCNTNLLKK
jgi:glycosyltransferase involved in cell wall biosynthesis